MYSVQAQRHVNPHALAVIRPSDLGGLGAEPKIQGTGPQTTPSNVRRCQRLWNNYRFPMAHTAAHSPEALASFLQRGNRNNPEAIRESRLTDYDPLEVAAPPRLVFWTESPRSN